MFFERVGLCKGCIDQTSFHKKIAPGYMINYPIEYSEVGCQREVKPILSDFGIGSLMLCS